MNIYVYKKGRRDGPYNSLQITQLVRHGELTLSDFAWHEGLDEWRPIHSIEEIVTLVLPPIPATNPAEPTGNPGPIQNPSGKALELSTLSVNTTENTQLTNTSTRKCSHCGTKYGADVAECPLDGTPLLDGIQKRKAKVHKKKGKDDIFKTIIIYVVIIVIMAIFFSNSDYQHQGGLYRILLELLSRGHVHE
jgi:hypothetical protein